MKNINDIVCYDKNKLYDFTATYDGKYLKMYINGVCIQEVERPGKIVKPKIIQF